MVVISVFLCSKQNKVLFARQYVTITKLRIERVLSIFIQLIKQHSDEEDEHRFIDCGTDNLRYLYKSFDELYVVMVTDKQSNVLTHMNALQMISKLIPQYCSDIDLINQNAFDLLYAMDEIINPMGSIEPVNMDQIHDFVQMESAEEKLAEIICKSKVQSCAAVMHKKSVEFDARTRTAPQQFGCITDTRCMKLGFSVGGAKDVNNFRECIKQNIMPSAASITYNGLLYEYYFDTSTTRHNTNDDDGTMLFYPSYCYAKVQGNDDKNEYEYYMSIGLNSNINQDDFKRKKLNLVIVLDISGSMRSGMCDNSQIAKIETATKAMVALLKHLNDDDRLGIVTFESSAECVQSLCLVGDIDVEALNSLILSIDAHGGTNFECGYSAAMDLYRLLFIQQGVMSNEYENRVIMLTDAQPNIGSTSPRYLMNMVSKCAEMGMDIGQYQLLNNRIYTTFIGVGLDFNVRLIEAISDIRGCNYYSVNSIKEFMNKMDEEFEYMVTPLVFNVCLKLNCEGNACEIDKVFGSHKANDMIKQSGEITKINTLFPSKRDVDSGEVQGGIQLIKLVHKNDKSIAMNVEIEVTFEDRNGKKYQNKQMVTFQSMSSNAQMIRNDMIEADEPCDANYYDNTGIRKAILLCKYAQLLMDWLQPNTNINNSNYKQIFGRFLQHFQDEMTHCNDDKLQKEVDVMQQVIDINNSFANHYVMEELNDIDTDLPSIEITITEKLYLTVGRDGGLQTFDVKGDLSVIVNHPTATQCAIVTNINPSVSKQVHWRLHPRMDRTQWNNQGVLSLKDTSKQFRVGRSRQKSILKWRMRATNDEHIPITVEFWPEMDELNGLINVNVQFMCNIALQNVVITFPMPHTVNKEPDVQAIDEGSVRFSRSDHEYQWILNDLQSNSEGLLEYIVEPYAIRDVEDLWPVTVNFEIRDTAYSQLRIKEIHNVHDGQKYEHAVKTMCYIEKYCIS